MDEVLELAGRLSRAIARSSRFLDLREAESAVVADGDARRLIERREEVLSGLAEKEARQQPIEPEEKRELRSLDEQVKTHPRLSALWKAQADFQEMLNLVNEKITSALHPGEPGEGPGEESGEGPRIILPS